VVGSGLHAQPAHGVEDGVAVLLVVLRTRGPPELRHRLDFLRIVWAGAVQPMVSTTLVAVASVAWATAVSMSASG
jgi:hypothetical protein